MDRPLSPQPQGPITLAPLNSAISFPNRIVGRANLHPVMLNGVIIQSLIDTGSQVSLMSESLYRSCFNYLELQSVDAIMGGAAPRLRTVSGEELRYVGAVEVRVRLGEKLAGTNEAIDVLFLIIKDTLVGKPTHDHHLCLIGMNAVELMWPIWSKRVKPHTCLLDFAYSGLVKAQLTENTKESFVGRLKVMDEVIIPPEGTISVRCSLRSKLVGMTATVLMESETDGLTKVSPTIREVPLGAFSRVSVPVTNNTLQDVKLAKGAEVCKAWLTSIPFQLETDDLELAVANINLDEFSEIEHRMNAKGSVGLEDDEEDDVTPDMKLLWDHVDSLKHLSQAQRDKLVYCLGENHATFSKSEYDIGKVKGVKHGFVLKDDIPFKVRHRNLPPRMYAAARDHINQLLDKEIIRPSTSPYSSAPMFLQKPDGRVRMVADLRMLNAKVVRDNYALPRFDDILPYLKGSKYFTKMDIRSGYYNIEVEERDKEKTAFSTVFGLYEYNRMVQGCKTSAATFQRCMENVLRPLLYEGVVAFLDDVIIYSRTAEEHLELLDKVLKLMQTAGLKLHPGKCTLMSPEIVYLGHIVSQAGVQANPEKTETLKNWPKIRTVKDVMSFIGFCSYFRRHIPHFSHIAQPLLALTKGVKYRPKSMFGPPVMQPALKKNIEDEWTSECQAARDKLIELLTTPPLLIFPDLNKPFIVHVDACTTGLGAVLLQFGDDQLLHPVCYGSRSLKAAERNYPAFKLEFLALKWAVTDKFHFYLYGQPFKVYTDNNPLTYIHKSLKVDATSQRWLAALGDYDFTIHYKPGSTNVDADVLSRLHEYPEEYVEHISAFTEGLDAFVDYCDVTDYQVDVLATTASVFDWQKLQLEDEDLVQIRRFVREHTKMKPDDFPKRYRRLFFVKEQLRINDKGVLCKKTVIDGNSYELVVLPHAQLPNVLRALHTDSGHLGVERVAAFFQRRFYYPGYSKAISQYVASCGPCILKKSRVVRQGELGEVTATRPFETLSMDYLSLEYDTYGYGHVLVITDVFTKFAFAVPTKNEKALTVAKVLVDKVFSVFGIPERLLSDRGRNFESLVIEQMCKLMGIKKVFTCPYSPRSDAVCERFNRTLIDMLGTLAEDERASWSKYVTHMVNVYNSSVHSSTGFAPFELIFGRKSRLPIDQVLGTYPVENEYPNLRAYVEALKARMEFVHKLALENLQDSHLRNKYRYDQTVHPIKLEPGDKVFVRNVGVRGMHKLAPTFLPEVYEVVREVDGNPRVYEVKCITKPGKTSRILHIDMLRKVSDIVDRYRRDLIPGYPGLGESGGDDMEKLFAGESGHKPGASNRDLGHGKARTRQPPRQRAYWLRSSSKKDDEPPQDSGSESDEEREQEHPNQIRAETNDLLEVPKHAFPHTEVEVPRDDDSSSSTTSNGSVSESVDDVPLGDEVQQEIPSEEELQSEHSETGDESAEEMSVSEDLEELPAGQSSDDQSEQEAALQAVPPVESVEQVPTLRRSGRSRALPKKLEDFVLHALWGIRHSSQLGPVTQV